MAVQFARILVPVELLRVDGEPGPGSLVLGDEDDPVEISQTTRRVLGLARAMGGPGSSICLLHVVPAFERVGISVRGMASVASALAEVQRGERARAEDLLGELAARLLEGHQVEPRVAEGAPVEAILECANDWQADAIVLATSGRGSVARFFLGSTADRVIRGSKVPVLVVPS